MWVIVGLGSIRDSYGEKLTVSKYFRLVTVDAS